MGVWGGVAGLASAVGVLLGGLLTEGPGWRWVMFVNPVAVVLVLGAILRVIPGDRQRARLQNFDALGAVLATGGMLLLVFALVKAPTVGWGKARTIGELGAALALLAAFVVNELRHRNPLAPLSIFRINGLGFSNLTQLIAFAGFLAVFFYLTLYMQNVLGYSAIQTGAAYLPLCFAIGIAAGISSQLLSRVGTRPVIVAGAVIAAGGMYWLSRIPVHGSFLADLLPGMLVLSVGIAAGVRRRHHRSQRGRSRRQSRARRLAAERLTTSRWSARAGDLHRDRDQPNPASTRDTRTRRARAHGRLPTSVARRERPHSRRRRDRVTCHQHPRRRGPGHHPRRTSRARTSMSENACVQT